MMPSQEAFIGHMKQMKVRKDDLIVCFDHDGIFSAPRVWFTFRTFGAGNVRVLDGGLPAWKAAGLPISHNALLKGASELDPDRSGSYAYVKNHHNIVDMRFVNHIVPKILTNNLKHYLMDARARERFEGKVAEPRKGLRKGHIPGAISTPFKELLADDGVHMKSVPELRAYFDRLGVDISRPITASCGSGLTACVILLALQRIGAQRLSLYDGSWSEYGAFPELNWQYVYGIHSHGYLRV